MHFYWTKLRQLNAQDSRIQSLPRLPLFKTDKKCAKMQGFCLITLFFLGALFSIPHEKKGFCLNFTVGQNRYFSFLLNYSAFKIPVNVPHGLLPVKHVAKRSVHLKSPEKNSQAEEQSAFSTAESDPISTMVAPPLIGDAQS